MKRSVAYLTSFLVASQFFCMSLEARPTTGEEAAMVVRGWLRSDARPFGVEMGRDVAIVEAFTNETGDILYYIVSLDSSGFVIVPSDDRVEPIMGFAQSGTYDPSPDNPLAALVANDVNRRLLAAVVSEQVALTENRANGVVTATIDEQETESQLKWRRLSELGVALPAEMLLASVTTDQMDDLRVAPLLKTRWDQTTCWAEKTDSKGTHMADSGAACYNFYTPPSDPGDPCDYLVPVDYSGVPGTYGDPNNYPSGCVATAMAQLMRYYQWPQEGIGKQESEIRVKYGEQWQSEKAWTRGGDGQGGPYDWANMLALPECGNPSQLKAIGALCYDAGVSVGMEYSEEGSSASTTNASAALVNSFNYMNAVEGLNVQDGNAVNVGAILMEMINPNLDAGRPVILAIKGLHNGQQSDHAIVCDGYGFDSSAIYHHLNMGWAGFEQDCAAIWYQLVPPDISHNCEWCKCAENDPNCQCPDCWYIYKQDWDYDTILSCVYNIFPQNTGEIISGRVLDASNKPVSGITVFAESTSDPNDLLSDETDPNGIFALVGCQSETEYVVSVDSPDVNYPKATIQTKTSKDMTAEVGNFWDLVLRDPDPLFVPDDHLTIQAALDAATDGQLVIVRSGTYTGAGNRDLDFKGKAITLISESGTDACIIDCRGSADDQHQAFYFHTRETSASTVDGFTVINGYENQGGAVYCDYYSNPTIRNCVFRDNFAVSKGGALYNDKSDPMIVACTFISNSAGPPDANTGDGGAIFNSGSSPRIISSLFTGNSAQGSGGAIYSKNFSGMESCRPSEELRDHSCTETCYPPVCWWNGTRRVCTREVCIWRRPYTRGSYPKLTNCTLVSNSSTNSAALEATGTITIENCIVWDNSPEQVTSGTHATVTYSNVQGGFAGDGNIDVDPLFIDPANGDYRLQANSPCVNTGDPDGVIETLGTDLDGRPRIAGGRVDMGAYEF